jgi:hypothetical protein
MKYGQETILLPTGDTKYQEGNLPIQLFISYDRKKA